MVAGDVGLREQQACGVGGWGTSKGSRREVEVEDGGIGQD